MCYVRACEMHKQRVLTLFLLTFFFATTWIEERPAPAETQDIVTFAVNNAVAVSVRRARVRCALLLRKNTVAFAHVKSLDDFSTVKRRPCHVNVRLGLRQRKHLRDTAAGHVRIIARVEHSHLKWYIGFCTIFSLAIILEIKVVKLGKFKKFKIKII